jgi:acetylglutamate/LysW-gamma-L-alpha-aminoadipate kinase
VRIVVKIGGSILQEDLTLFAQDIKQISKQHEVILVHGGARIVTQISEKMGTPPKFIVSPDGYRSRYTDKDTIETFLMGIAGKANKTLVQILQKHGNDAFGLSGIDGGFLRGPRKTKLKVREGKKILMIDGGFTGVIKKVRIEILEMLLEKGLLPVVATVALSDDFHPLNIDGDRTAARIAASIKADYLISLTDVPGVLDDQGQLIQKIPINELVEEIKRVKTGMKRKLHAVQEALRAGVNSVRIASGLVENPLTNAIQGKECTVISNEQ